MVFIHKASDIFKFVFSIEFVINKMPWKYGPDPIKKISCLKLCYTDWEHSDWLKELNGQSECIKLVNLR